MSARVTDPISQMFLDHHDEAMRLAIRMVGGRAQGEDVVMSVWLRLLGRKPGAALPGHPRSYLFRAVRNMALDHLARSRFEVAMPDHLLPDCADPAATDGPDRMIRHERAVALARAINGLDPRSRQAFILCRLEEMPYAAIARQMEVSVSMVEKHIIRALKACRQALADFDSRD